VRSGRPVPGRPTSWHQSTSYRDPLAHFVIH
jgi:hypothetical protein